MPEAVIVSAARTPIGRANKGSLTEMRPDELTAFIIKTALDKIPARDPATVDDHYLGCGLPGGESGNNMARVVNVLNGMDSVPGATITRYCSSSVQTTRMAFHAIFQLLKMICAPCAEASATLRNIVAMPSSTRRCSGAEP